MHAWSLLDSLCEDCGQNDGSHHERYGSFGHLLPCGRRALGRSEGCKNRQTPCSRRATWSHNRLACQAATRKTAWTLTVGGPHLQRSCIGCFCLLWSSHCSAGRRSVGGFCSNGACEEHRWSSYQVGNSICTHLYFPCSPQIFQRPQGHARNQQIFPWHHADALGKPERWVREDSNPGCRQHEHRIHPRLEHTKHY